MDREFWNAHSEWSQRTFGYDHDRGPLGPLNHLAKEVGEAIANPKDLMEYADMILLTLDAARRAGFTIEALHHACWAKLAINQNREWGKPNADGSVEHVRT